MLSERKDCQGRIILPALVMGRPIAGVTFKYESCMLHFHYVMVILGVGPHISKASLAPPFCNPSFCFSPPLSGKPFRELRPLTIAAIARNSSPTSVQSLFQGLWEVVLSKNVKS